MTLEQRQALLELVRKFKAAECSGSWLPQSAIQKMTDAVPDELMRDIVEDRKRGMTRGWLPQLKSEPVHRGSGWQSPPKAEDGSRQFAQFDAMVAHMVGGPNDTSKLR